MKIIRATHLGMCFGVRDAIELAETKAQEQPLTILGDLVHNENVLADLRAQGIRIAQKLDQVKTPHVMITAHGASEKTIESVRAQGFNISEATCPLVHFAHRSVRQLVDQGYHPVIIGKRDHVEVRGMTEDLAAFDVVLDESDIQRLTERPRFGIASQTTQPIERVRHLVRCIQKQFPKSEVRFIDTVCQPTKLRQSAAIDLAKQADVVVVIGGAHSNNTRQLVETCSKHCSRVHHVQSADDLHLHWFDRAETIGITAGTSTPDHAIDAIEQWIRSRTREANRQLTSHLHYAQNAVAP
ncbi:MAG: 4-hydroxy-3-methylbut-2-enyl diphosphate reductase [Limisphaerales bacterium]